MRKVGKNGKRQVFVAFTSEIYVVISIGSMSQICCVVDSINSTLSTRKGFGYLRKRLAEEAKQAIRAAVSWTDAISALRRDEGRHWTNFRMSNRAWIAYWNQYFLHFNISQIIKWLTKTIFIHQVTTPLIWIWCSHPTPKTGETNIGPKPQATRFSFHCWDGLR